MLILSKKEKVKGNNIDVDALIGELLAEIAAQRNHTVLFTDKAKASIHEIAGMCKDIPIVKETQEQAEEYAKALTAEQVFIDMLYKINAAPTEMHMRLSARMLIPVIDKKLREGTSDEKR